jgi:hypothetical protein
LHFEIDARCGRARKWSMFPRTTRVARRLQGVARVRHAYLLAILFVASSARAGESLHRPVIVDAARHRASGWVASRGSLEPIGCHVYSAFAMRVAVCYAHDPDGTTAQCTTRDRELMTIAAATNRQTFLAFEWDAEETCTRIDIGRASARRSDAFAR